MSQIQQIINGLLILRKYNDCVSAEHDIIYAGPNKASFVNGEDQMDLEKLGWNIDSSMNIWSYNV